MSGKYLKDSYIKINYKNLPKIILVNFIGLFSKNCFKYIYGINSVIYTHDNNDNNIKFNFDVGAFIICEMKQDILKLFNYYLKNQYIHFKIKNIVLHSNWLINKPVINFTSIELRDVCLNKLNNFTIIERKLFINYELFIETVIGTETEKYKFEYSIKINKNKKINKLINKFASLLIPFYLEELNLSPDVNKESLFNKMILISQKS
jgi:hypothetical protein